MNRILTITVLMLISLFAHGQQCLDAIVTQAGDTIFGKTIEVTDSSYTMDSYNLVLSVNKAMVKQYIPCCKEVTRLDLMRMKPIESLSNKDLYQFSSGYYLRKASRTFYLGLPLTLAGTTAITVSLATHNKPSQRAVKWAIFSGGVVATAGGVFFLLKSFYLIDKAGKIMDLERSAIYLDSGGTIGIIWKF